MTKSFISDLSTTAGSNTDLAGVGVAGSNLVSQGDNAFRSLAAMVAQFYEDLGGLGTVGGTGDAITLTAQEAWTAYGTGDGQINNGTILAFKAGAANTGAVTINVNAIGTKAIQAQGDTALGGGALVANAMYLLRYDTAYNAAAGAWVLLNGGSPAASTTEQLTGTSTAKASTPDSVAALWEAGADNSGGATITMGEGAYFNCITSTTSITALAFTTDKAGRRATLRFDTSRTLTHNATSLIIPGGGNLSVQQGDQVGVRSLGSGNFVVEWFTKGSAAPIQGTALLASGTVSSAATLDIVLTSYTGYRGILIKLINFIPATDAVTLQMRVSTDGGSSYDASAGAYWYINTGGYSNSGVLAIIRSTGATSISLADGIGNGASEGITSDVTIMGQTNTAVRQRIGLESWYYDSNNNAGHLMGTGLRATAQDTDAVRFLFSSGNIGSGTYAVYGDV